MTWWSWSPEKTETRFCSLASCGRSFARLPRGVGDGNVEREACFRRAGHGFELFNLGSIIGGVAFGWWLDPHFGTRSLIGLSIGTLIGGIWQLSSQFPSLRRVGYKYHADFHWRDQGVRTVLMLMVRQ